MTWPPWLRVVLVPLLAIAAAPDFCAGQNLAGLVTEAHAPATPVRGAVVRVKQPGAARLAAELETGNDGRFAAPTPLPAGDYRIEISKPNHAAASLPLRLPAAAPLEVQLTRFGSIAGRVTDGQNRPAPGARVLVMVAAEEDATQFRPARYGEAVQVDTAGNYRAFGLAPGRYALAVTWANMGSGGREAPVAGAYLFPSNTRPEIFTISSGTAITGIDFVLPAQSDYAVSGRVTGLAPKQTAALALAPADQPSLAAALVQSTPEGEFRFDRVAPGSYLLRAAAPMEGYGMLGASLGEPAKYGETRVVVAGQAVSGIEVALEPPRALRFVLESTAACPVATPLALMLEPIENWASLSHAPVTLKPNQETVVKDLAPGRFRVRLAQPAEGGCSPPRHLIADASRSGETVRIRLEASGALEVAGAPAAAAITLSPLDDPNAPVRILMPGGAGSRRVDGLRAGRYRLQAGARAIEAEIRAGATATATFPAEEAKP